MRQHYALWALSSPEQFGSTPVKQSATTWDHSDLAQGVLPHKILRRAFNRCEFGETHRRPTGALINITLREIDCVSADQTFAEDLRTRSSDQARLERRGRVDWHTKPLVPEGVACTGTRRRENLF